ncbi:hypothetical protein H6G54_09800 [Anabaena cylindrica FACHB-243]|uniref:Uncharacterized protein n=1 Tax=Anabaena cylindrica (strain ATCC 27899 / PCC 7122) TaxID=272123 RepID=K9ZDS8_ANACC|nr:MULTISPECIES: hypothetical protein [Anabaena]AFZ56727.1 hypothetical protein Anacy_1175 [Anabaena cylindrica PCC 7122]MBD2417998.1 hypothetical protein [Anabaena cylindrica FACHB-243]MBY5284523.1 hypothetical protein [Anabaena sp. CCAP 1446/1C]MBY5310947.1 hypothetical protein [Anabaena sp. CCAP 1446/1C]MCM2409471.1 hypothetical protein [Anabaena sp. CCAP 1446/1C]
MLSDPIISTLEKIIALHDGIAEPASEHTLNVLLTENLASLLSLPEDVTFTTKADVSQSVFVTYHSEVLNKLSDLLSTTGQVSALGIKYDGYLKNTNFDKLLTERFVAQNGLIKFVDAKPEITRYILCNVAYTANAEEKRIGLVSFIINELTGVTPVEIGNALFWEADRIAVDEQDLELSLPIANLLNLIETRSEILVSQTLENWQAKLIRARTRDEERLKDYYNTISAEILRKIESKGLIDADKDKELARIEATNKELERKLLDVQERYKMSVEAWLHSSMIIHLPTVHIQFSLQRKKAKRIVTAVWNPFTKIIEPLRCEVSGEPVYNFYLDDADAKIISSTVWNK